MKEESKEFLNCMFSGLNKIDTEKIKNAIREGNYLLLVSYGDKTFASHGQQLFDRNFMLPEMLSNLTLGTPGMYEKLLHTMLCITDPSTSGMFDDTDLTNKMKGLLVNNLLNQQINQIK